VELEKIRNGILSGKTIEEILEGFNWQNFEKIVEEIFERNDFKIKRNFRFKTKKRYEIDIIATRENIAFCIDCKRWGRGRYKRTGLGHAIKDQENRVNELAKFLKRNPLAKESLKININQTFPLLVTLLQENVIKEDNTFVVPVWKLNSFLLEVERYF